METYAKNDECGSVVHQRKRVAPRQTQDAAIDLIGGTAGGVASVYVGQPLDTIKVKMQTFPTSYRNAWYCFRTVLAEEGLSRGLYAGTVPSLAAQVSENAILFMAYGMCQKGIALLTGKKNTLQLNPLENAVAGGAASFFSSLALCPTELIKCKLQAMKEMKESGQLKGSLAKYSKISPSLLVKHTLREEGVQGLYRGMLPTLAREMPGYFFFFGGYEVFRMLLTPHGKTKDDLSPLRLIICGGMGGVTLWVAVFPTDVIKSRIQVSTNPESIQNLSYIGVLQKIVREEGFRALYKGLGPTLVRTFFATGALFVAYENTKKLLTRLCSDEDSEMVN